MATAQPAGQARNAWGRDHGNYASVANMPNGSANVLPSATVPFTLEPGDRCCLTTGIEYLCVSAGTPGAGDAVWVANTGVGPWSSVLYVDNVRGSDTTGQRGNANRPFATIQAAVNAAQTDDVVQISPGIHTVAAPVTFPVALVRVSLCGMNAAGGTTSGTSVLGGTRVRSTTGAVFDCGANLGLSRLGMYFLNIQTTNAASPAIAADGSAYAAGTFLNILVIDNCIIQGGGTGGTINGKYTGVVYFSNTQLLTGQTFFTNYSQVRFDNARSDGIGGTFDYDVADPLTPTASGTVFIRNGSTIGGTNNGVTQAVTLSHQAQLVVDSTSAIGGLRASGLTVSGTTRTGIACCGSIGAANAQVIDFASAGSELPDTALVMVLDFRGARLVGVFGSATVFTNGVVGPTTVKFKVAGAAANFQTVKFDGSMALPGCTFTADVAVHLTGRGAQWPQCVLTTPGANGDIIPPVLTGTIDIAAGGTVAKTWVQLGYAGFIRAGAAPDSAFVTSIVQGADAVISVRATTGLTFISTAQAGNTAADWQAIWK